MALLTVSLSTPDEWAPLRQLGTLPPPVTVGNQTTFALAGPTPRLLALTIVTVNPPIGPSQTFMTTATLIAGTTLGDPVLHTVTGLTIPISGFGLSQLLAGDFAAGLMLNDDSVFGATGADRLAGHGGNDSIAADGGSDWVEGGAANDTLLGEAGNDALFGGAGDDLLDGGIGRDVLRGGVGDDTIRLDEPERLAGLGAVFDGGEGTDVLAIAGAAGALLDLREARITGIETLRFDSAMRLVLDAAVLARIETVELAQALETTAVLQLDGAGQFALGGFAIEGDIGRGLRFALGDGDGAIVFGREGAMALPDDSILGGAGASTIFGGDGADTLDGGGGNDRLEGEDGADSLSGGEGADTLVGGAGADTLRGGLGDDTYAYDRAEGDVAIDTGGIDTWLAGRVAVLPAFMEHAVLSARGRITGNAADNRLVGSAGADSLTGSGGADTLIGGRGADELQGGQGNDRYVVGPGESSAAARDRILDFSRLAGDRDRIDLAAFDPVTGGADSAFDSVAAAGAAGDATAGRISFLADAGGTLLRGYGGAAPGAAGTLLFEIRVEIAGAWSAADFLL